MWSKMDLSPLRFIPEAVVSRVSAELEAQTSGEALAQLLRFVVYCGLCTVRRCVKFKSTMGTMRGKAAAWAWLWFR